MSSRLADKYKNDKIKNIVESEYTVITNSKDLLELELRPVTSIACSEVFLFKEIVEQKEKKKVNLKIKYKDNQIKRITSEWNEIIENLTKNKPILKAMLENSDIKVANKDVVLSLSLKGAKFLCQNRYDKEIKKVIDDLYSCNCNLIIEDEIDHQYCQTISSEIIEEQEKLTSNIIKEIKNGNGNGNISANKDEQSMSIGNTTNTNKAKDKTNSPSQSFNNIINSKPSKKDILKKNDNNSNYNSNSKTSFNYNTNVDFSNPNLIIGKIRVRDLPLVKIEDINDDTGMLKVEGEITSYNVIEIRDGKAIVTINIHDGTYSIYSKSFVLKDDLEEIEKRLKKAKKIRIFGKVDHDSYSNELIIKGSTIIDITDENNNSNLPSKAEEKNKQEMKDEKQKEDKDRIERVELTAHTHMSMLEGLISPKDLISIVKKNNMKAIGITDSSVVQAYPEIMYETMDADIKPIYGLKGVLAADSKSALSFSKNQNIASSTYCILDIETTGLSFRSDKITELAVIKYKDGKIIDKYETFVNPEMKIPKHITKITGITDEMVKNAPKKEEVIKEFLEFIGDDSILVAHNADFDIGFIKYIVEKMNLEMNHTYIDTLILARMLYTELSRFSQGSIAEHLKIKVEVAHRAMDDVKILSKIFENMLEKLKNDNIQNWDDIDEKLNIDEEAYKRAQTYDFTALIKNNEGLREMYSLVSDSHIKHYYFRPRILKSILSLNRSGLLLGSGNHDSEIYSAILAGKTDEEIEDLMEFYDFIEVQPISNHNSLIQTEKVEKEDDLRGINKKIINMADKLGKLVVATGDVYIKDPEDVFYKEVLDVSRKRWNPEIQNDTHFRSTDDMLEEFSYLGKDKAYEIVVINSNKIADMCENISPISKVKATPQIKDGDKLLRELCYTKAEELYGKNMPKKIKERLDKELNSIIENGYSALYLIAAKLVQKSNEDGYIVGSRGSVGSSFAAYMANITEVNSLDPHYRCPSCKLTEFSNLAPTGIDLKDKNCPKCKIKFIKDGMDIPFETFLGFTGNKEPDIDLNFSSDYQSKIHDYVETIIGNGKTYKAGTIGSIQNKTAIGYIIGYYENTNKPMPSRAEIERLSKKLVGVKRTTGQHPGGIIVVPEGHDILEFTPIQKPADKVDSKVITTHFDYHRIESNLLKLDLLGHDDPTTVKMLQDITGIDPVKIPLDDKETMSLFSSVKALGVNEDQIFIKVGTLGVPEFGTLFVRGMLEETRPTTFDELIKISGLSHGTDVWLNNAQNLIKKGQITLKEAICTRDDIMIYLISQGIEAIAAFDIMEKVRRGKGLTAEHENLLKENKISDWYINSCKTIKYMFPKAHATAYVTLAFRIAWFKVHYPEAFYTAYFSTMRDVFDSTYMINGKNKVKERLKEARKNFKKSKTDERLYYVLESLNEFYERGFSFSNISIYDSDSLKFKLDDNKKLIPPLASIPGLGEIAANSIVEARKDEDFQTKEDLKIRAKIGDSIIELLDQLDIISDLPDSMQMSLFEI